MTKLLDFPPQNEKDKAKIKKALSKLGRDFDKAYKINNINGDLSFLKNMGSVELDLKEWSDNMIIYFSKDGDLYRKPKQKYCYFLQETKLAIFKILSHRLTKTEEIRESVGSASSKSVRKMIGEINNKARNVLKLLKSQKLIEFRQGSGYRINTYYIIKKVKY
jgi:hypothetical protein